MTDHIVPFYSQSWDLDQWRSMGFESFEDARYWKESSCGVLCLKMTIDALRHSAGKSDSPQLIQYIHGGQALEAYTQLHGWSHDGLVELAKKLGTDAERHVRTTEAQLKKWLQQGLLPIVSIKAHFDTSQTLAERLFFWRRRGGHLAVLIGYEDSAQGEIFIFHHTSKQPEFDWKDKRIGLRHFKKSFTGRCIVIGPLRM